MWSMVMCEAASLWLRNRDLAEQVKLIESSSVHLPETYEQ